MGLDRDLKKGRETDWLKGNTLSKKMEGTRPILIMDHHDDGLRVEETEALVCT